MIFRCTSGETGMSLQLQILIAASDACAGDYTLHNKHKQLCMHATIYRQNHKPVSPPQLEMADILELEES